MRQDEMWDAVKNNDDNYDGIFFYAVKTTGIYCRPSCKSKLPNKENVEYFSTADIARHAGYRPCKRCRSDLLEYKPMIDIAQKTKKLLDDIFLQEQKLQAKIHNIGISPHRMNEIFKIQYGKSISEYVSQLRLEESKKRLLESNDAIIDIAYSMGFRSLSGFYRFFKENTETSPAKFRKHNAEK